MLYIHGIGHCHPTNIITNQFLEDLDIDTNSEWITKRVGIQQRRTVLPLDYIKKTKNAEPLMAIQCAEYDTAEAGARATNMALKKAKINLDQIGMVIGGSSSPKYSVPAEICSIAGKLGINAPAIDINSGCATFLAHMHMANSMQTESTPDYMLLVIPDHLTKSTNYDDRTTAVLFGDCTTAVIVSKKVPSKYQVNYTFLDSCPADWEKVIIPTGGHIEMEGRTVQKFAIRKTIESLKLIAKQTPYQPEKDYFIGHQANLSMLEYVCNTLNISDHHHLHNIELHGNCGGASAPSVLSQNWQRFQPGDKLAMVVVGTGLTWGGLHLQIQ